MFSLLLLFMLFRFNDVFMDRERLPNTTQSRGEADLLLGRHRDEELLLQELREDRAAEQLLLRGRVKVRPELREPQEKE